MGKLRGNQQLSGSWGQLWWNGELIIEVESFEAKVTANREDVAIGMDVDSKITSLKGEGSFKIKKVYTRGIDKMLASWVRGEDPRAQLVGKLSDPDAVGKQTERVVFNNVWFNEITLMQFEKGQKLEREFPFGFTPSDVEFPDKIEVR
ncbi:terminase [Thermanaerosceptrum fracticalcis]|uniref:Terminase n=1 Tax=Thermanaerosceptrum fracticalcis TaxID=1712410 RepID=A0A7G6E805_THEFR|nr:phage tail tube protein [Thermanaerosceptrum fracticalcis]QNB48209.1 terminase [Thermanaerosceptrum fracticalcis]